MEEKITIKDSWKEVAIKEYNKLSELAGMQFQSNVEYAIAILSILSGKSEDYFLSIPAVNIPACMEHTKFLSSQPLGGTIRDSYVINGIKYNAMLNVQEFSTIQYIDIATLLQDNENNKNLHRILSVILIPEGKEYNTYNLEEVQRDIYEHFSIMDAVALSAFFLKFTETLIKVIQSCSISKLKKMERKEKNPERKERIRQLWKNLKHSQKNGAGYTTLT